MNATEFKRATCVSAASFVATSDSLYEPTVRVLERSRGRRSVYLRRCTLCDRWVNRITTHAQAHVRRGEARFERHPGIRPEYGPYPWEWKAVRS